MKKIALATLAALFSMNTFAATFGCSYFWNLDEVYRNEVTIADGAKDIVIGEMEEYRFFITSLTGGKYELQALNENLPSRTYATARVSAESPELGLVIWTREHIMEVKCSLK